MIQWPRFCGPNSAPIDCEWLRFLSNSEVYKFVSWLFVFQGIQRRQPPSITIYHCISLENNHSVPQVFLWKKTHPSVPMTCPRNNSDLARSLVAWEEAWELGNDFLVPWAASVGFGFFFFVFFLGMGLPNVWVCNQRTCVFFTSASRNEWNGGEELHSLWQEKSKLLEAWWSLPLAWRTKNHSWTMWRASALCYRMPPIVPLKHQ